MIPLATVKRILPLLVGLLVPLRSFGQLPPSLVEYRAPQYPAELKGSLISAGFTTIAYVVNAEGAIDDAVVLEASHVAFGAAALDVLPAWRFERSPDSLPHREVLRLQFSQTDAVRPLSHLESTKAAFPLAAEERLQIRTLSWTQLSTPPERLSSIAPSGQLGVKTPGGKVAVSYVIDTAGHVRVPAVVSSPDPALGLAALTAVKQWRFAPPLHDGKPVLVEDQRSFTFAPTP